jgi:hypothetical protein
MQTFYEWILPEAGVKLTVASLSMQTFICYLSNTAKQVDNRFQQAQLVLGMGLWMLKSK